MCVPVRNVMGTAVDGFDGAGLVPIAILGSPLPVDSPGAIV